jgi:prepilin-type N-terminal cleavage/methylation domain-containing protein
MKKSAFTLLELIFVIVVIGILAVTFIPKFGASKLTEAANQLVSDIRYTRHLALIDDKYDPDMQYWYKHRWEIAFSTAHGTVAYYIFSDSPSITTGAYDGNPGANNNYTDVEVATNPENKHLYMVGGFLYIV